MPIDFSFFSLRLEIEVCSFGMVLKSTFGIRLGAHLTLNQNFNSRTNELGERPAEAGFSIGGSSNMETFTIMCSCGEVASVEATTRREAVRILSERWSEGMLHRHLREKHPKERLPSRTEITTLIASKLLPVTS